MPRVSESSPTIQCVTVVYSSAEFKYWILDFENQQVGFTNREDVTTWGPLTHQHSTNLAKTIFVWDNWWSFSKTKRGDGVISQVWSPINADQLQGRRVVYLDTMHWRTLGDVMAGAADRVKRRDEVQPARRLLELASDGKIVLPLSAGSMRETLALYGDRRYDVGVAIASASGGWQMRHPMVVRRYELKQAIAAHNDVTIEPHRPVITLEPNASIQQTNRPDDVPSDSIAYFMNALGWTAAMTDILIDNEVDIGAPDAVVAWMVAQQKQTDLLVAATELTKAQKRDRAHAFVLGDQQRDILWAATELGLSLDAVDRKNLHVGQPANQLLDSWMVQRYTNTVRWRRGDLNDVTYLSCAAGYADYVATEKQAHEYLRVAMIQAGRTPNTYCSLQTCVEALESDLAANPVENAQHVPQALQL